MTMFRIRAFDPEGEELIAKADHIWEATDQVDDRTLKLPEGYDEEMKSYSLVSPSKRRLIDRLYVELEGDGEAGGIDSGAGQPR